MPHTEISIDSCDRTLDLVQSIGLKELLANLSELVKAESVTLTPQQSVRISYLLQLAGEEIV